MTKFLPLLVVFLSAFGALGQNSVIQQTNDIYIVNGVTNAVALKVVKPANNHMPFITLGTQAGSVFQVASNGAVTALTYFGDGSNLTGISGGGSISLSNNVFVSKNGNNATGTRNRLDLPFLTITAAKAVAQVGDTIQVFPGVYDETDIAKNGVTTYFHAGAAIDYSGVSARAIFDDHSGATNFVVAGFGSFTNQTGNVFLITNDLTTVVAKGLFAASDDDAVVDVNSLFSDFTFTEYRVGDALGGSAASAVIVRNGHNYIHGSELIGGQSGLEIVAPDTGEHNLYCDVPSIYGYSHGISGTGSTNQNYRVWIVNNAQIIAYLGNGIMVTGRMYVNTEKVFQMDGGSEEAAVYAAGGSLWLSAQKLTGYSKYIWVNGEHAKIYANVLDYENRSDNVTTGVMVTEGALELSGPGVMRSSSIGVEHLAGTVRLNGVNITCDGGNPISVSANGLILNNCVLVSDGVDESIVAGDASAHTVKNYGSVANVAKSADITVQVEALVVSSDVE